MSQLAQFENHSNEGIDYLLMALSLLFGSGLISFRQEVTLDCLSDVVDSLREQYGLSVSRESIKD